MKSSLANPVKCPVCGKGNLCDAGSKDLLEQTEVIKVTGNYSEPFGYNLKCPICKQNSWVRYRLTKTA